MTPTEAAILSMLQVMARIQHSSLIVQIENSKTPDSKSHNDFIKQSQKALDGIDEVAKKLRASAVEGLEDVR